MNRREKNPFQSNSTSQTAVLINWLTVVADFNSLYNQLTTCLTAGARQPNPLVQKTLWVGQCRIDQIEALLATMHSELEAMLCDADRFEHLNTQEGYDQLAVHVVHLKHLNQQAQVLLCLTSLPTG